MPYDYRKNLFVYANYDAVGLDGALESGRVWLEFSTWLRVRGDTVKLRVSR